ncbi:methyl-accepting chemotaxis protein [Nostoc sp. FACHB-152]|uniref:methyl-accepting chemotaxis protein n=1 Tax=unclassified Nostoc TaxID=2593658 RepID=UPI001687893F|nr:MULTISPECIES: methyl-accepting chemotaxis protein [unclassified Nostoc]MBD2448453.1 methyl-accepting chemotaxis protein [Nostoc sp. FACHB-152]MBD2466190.1 methyl-accepting chemotaxis protein [Nostoc sp. FACHB-145]
MFNRTGIAKSRDGKNRSSLIKSTKISENKIKLLNSFDSDTKHELIRYFKQQSLETKATVLAIAISTIPALLIGAIAYNLANQSLIKKITQYQTTEALGLTDQVNRFMSERYGDLQVLSNLSLLTNSNFSNNINAVEKQVLLDKLLTAYKVYDNIAVFDTNSSLIVQSSGQPLDNQKDNNYIQETLQKEVAVISQPTNSHIYLAAPIIDTATGRTIGVVRTSLPTKSLQEAIKANGHQYALLDQSGKVFLSSQKELLGKAVKTEYPSLAKSLATNNVTTLTTVPKSSQKQQLVSYVPAQKIAGLPDLNWQVLLATDAASLYGTQQQLFWLITIGTVLIGGIVAAIAAKLAKLTIQPILNATDAIAKLGKGELNTRLASQREDELGVLSANIDDMAAQLQVLVKEQAEIAQAKTIIRPVFTGEQPTHEALQLQLVALLNDIEGAAKGDLTVRAEVTDGEIGTVADFFNSIVENLRDIVTQVKQAATQVNTAIGSNETAIRQLADEALVQVGEITHALDAVDNMTNSMQAVATSAEQAATVANNAAQKASMSEETMYLTVQNILSLRESVGETAQKVKRLGESSQQISRVVSLINQIAMETNLLAINAGIEAARAGEEGQGFAVVAEEVGELAARSAAATQEIEQIVEKIQRETSAVVQAIEIGTTQVGEGARVVEEAKQNLGQIFDVSRQIDSLVQSISSATASQVQTSQTVSVLMKNIAAVSQRTSDSSSLICQSLKQTVEISHKLQETVETFKVN